MNRPLHALALAAVLATTACGAGRDAQTYQERSTADATNDAIGALAVRNVSIVPETGDAVLEAGSTVRATITVVSEDDRPDRLVSVRSDAAQSVAVVRADGSSASMVVPPLGTTADAVYLELRGLTRDVRPGQYVAIELTFERNGSKEFLVPVRVVPDPQRQAEREQQGGEEGEGPTTERGEEGSGDGGKAENSGGTGGNDAGSGR